MSKQRSTPGPWRPWFLQGINLLIRPQDPALATICEVHQPGRSNGEAEANARLIAAAPAFLEACCGTDPAGEPTPLDHLAALLGSLREDYAPGDWTALDESEGLLAGLRAAVARAEGGAKTR